MLSAVDGAVIRILHQPHLSIAFAGVKLCHGTKNIQENGLRNVLRLTGIANNLQCDAQDQLLVAVEEDSERVALSLLQAGHKLLVRQSLELWHRQRHIELLRGRNPDTTFSVTHKPT